jgi:2-polyprenyl-6-methoxyphenol hydroxylase-like FAD-dependent oxidoreductase
MLDHRGLVSGSGRRGVPLPSPILRCFRWISTRFPLATRMVSLCRKQTSNKSLKLARKNSEQRSGAHTKSLMCTGGRSRKSGDCGPDGADLHEASFGIARTSTGNFAIVPIDSEITRVAAVERDQAEVDRDLPMTLDELQQALPRVIGTELPMSKPRWMTRATDASRQAERYREGRVLLAGDAAHVHFAYGGMGLQTGIQDAGNLGWKLAAQIHGWAPAGLLDTYDAERQLVGRRVFMATRAATALARPGGHVTALRELVGELLKREQVYRTIIEMITSVDVHYDVDSGGRDHHRPGRPLGT